jgi:hypothetical protein
VTLPLSRNRTYAAATVVKSSDLNDIQDRIIALHSQVRGARPLGIQPVSAQKTNCTWNSAGYLAATSGGAMFFQEVPAFFDARPTRILFDYWGAGGSNTITVRLKESYLAIDANLRIMNVNDPAASWATFDTGPIDWEGAFELGGAMYLQGELSHSGQRVKNFRLHFDRFPELP